MLKNIIVVVLVLITSILIYASTKPDSFHVTRNITINASPEKVFAELNDFNRWKLWSPWEKKDPSMQRTISGAALGVGSVYEWNGNKDVGQGRMEIIESKLPQQIIIKLDFIKPFEGHNIAEFTLTPANEGTQVSWEMHGPQIFIGKLMSLFFDMDKMIGGDFELGLSNLMQLSEKKGL